MAARTQKTSLTKSWRLKIQASQIANRLFAHLNGEVELTATQIQAAKILFDRMEPVLSRSEVKTDNPLLGAQAIPDGALMVVMVRQLSHAGWRPEDAKVVAGELLGLPEKTLGDIEGEAVEEKNDE